jgi:L-alanine-DL-glutamate epimerase-like enolase superfamily enzyme
MVAMSHPNLTWEPIVLRLRTAFRVAYGASETRTATWLRLVGAAGWGEGTIPPYYGISDQAMAAYWRAAAQQSLPFPDDPAGIPAWVGEEGPAPARCAVDLALHDRIARQRGVPIYELLGLPRPPVLPTSYTISIGEPAEMAEMAAAAAYPILKIKLGTDDDASRLAAVRAARPDARLRVDANAAWSPDEAVPRVRALEPFGLELIEQPVAKNAIAAMGYVQAHTDLPVVADESVQTLADVERLAAAGVRGINLKLMKVGGLAPGLRILRRAQELGMQVLLGCMVETSLGVTAMLHLASLADWLDLDAPLLVANDPFEGATYDRQAGMHLPDRPGIGVRVRGVFDDSDSLDSSEAFG